MKSEVFFVSAAPTARDSKKDLALQVKIAIDAVLGRAGDGFKIINFNVAADIISNFQKALVTIIYDGELKPVKK